MGWIKQTISFVLSITQLDTFTPYVGYDTPQKPLTPPSPTAPVISATPFVCSYPELEAKGWEFCNTESSRDCWMRDPSLAQPGFTQYDVKTDYEKPHSYPKGITREYWVDIDENPEFSPDGVPKRLGKYINGTYPGPAIEACWGDQVVIHVTNKRVDNGTTIHWHGIRQLHSNEMDGVNGITQCPIAPGDTFTYNFTAMQHGNSWYHSHYSVQYGDGVAAPLVIHGPTSDNWDVDLGSILIADWIHETAYIAYEGEMDGGIPPLSDSILVNGKGHFNGSGSYHETTLVPGKKNLLRLINGGVGMSYVFSIDDHNLTVVASDLVDVQPFTVQSLMVGIGQRYTVIVEGKDQTDGDYWMRTVPAIGCGDTLFSVTPDNKTAIVRYDSASTALPRSQPQPQTALCDDTDVSLLNPIVPWCVDQHPQNNVTKDTYRAELQDSVDDTLGPPSFPYAHWQIAAQPMWLDFSKPTILNIDESKGNPNYTVVEEDYSRGFIYMIIDTVIAQNVTHPIHLHGSDFVILAQSKTPWDEKTSPSLFNFDNPPRRDTAMVPASGFLAIAFKPDNPGAWLVHCHIAWHASSGLAFQILIRPKDIPDWLGDFAETRRVCDNWAKSDLAPLMPIIQDDSGI